PDRAARPVARTSLGLPATGGRLLYPRCRLGRAPTPPWSAPPRSDHQRLRAASSFARSPRAPRQCRWPRVVSGPAFANSMLHLWVLPVWVLPVRGPSRAHPQSLSRHARYHLLIDTLPPSDDRSPSAAKYRLALLRAARPLQDMVSLPARCLHGDAIRLTRSGKPVGTPPGQVPAPSHRLPGDSLLPSRDRLGSSAISLSSVSVE